MNRFVMAMLVLGFMVWTLGACNSSEDLGSPAGAKPKVGPSSQTAAPATKADVAVQQKPDGGAETKTARVKESSRTLPGWQCSSHPNVKSFYPDPCPICKLPMTRQGEYTCENHPQVSATSPGTCLMGNEPLLKVMDLEKKTGKTIEQLTQDALAKQKG